MMELTWRLDDCLDQAKRAWKFFEWYKIYLTSDNFPETSFPLLLHSTRQHIQQLHHQNVELLWPTHLRIFPRRIPSSELSRLLLDQEMNFAVAAAFSSSPLSTTLLRHYLFLSHNLEWIRQDLLRHQQERESIFDVLSHSAPFQDIITPIVLNFRYRQRQVSPVTC